MLKFQSLIHGKLSPLYLAEILHRECSIMDRFYDSDLVLIYVD